ncbi:MAG: MobA/MobL family protein [Oscillospiraceae bacterium]|nr:MobA/MobL family protein [Oscillospiraceae bacterium]
MYTTDWNEHSKAEEWRKAWADVCNDALRISGALSDGGAIDHRSYARQGV